jgi:hypothetical protein
MLHGVFIIVLLMVMARRTADRDEEGYHDGGNQVLDHGSSPVDTV